jgi:hypothetical protein
VILRTASALVRKAAAHYNLASTIPVSRAPIRTAHAKFAVAIDLGKAGSTPIFVDDIGKRYTANWPEPSHEVADRQQGI